MKILLIALTLFTWSVITNVPFEPVLADHCRGGYYGSYPDYQSPPRGSLGSPYCCPIVNPSSAGGQGRPIAGGVYFVAELMPTGGGPAFLNQFPFGIFCSYQLTAQQIADKEAKEEQQEIDRLARPAPPCDEETFRLMEGTIGGETIASDCIPIPAIATIEFIQAYIEYEIITDAKITTGIIGAGFDFNKISQTINIDELAFVTDTEQLEEINIKMLIDFSEIGIPVTVNDVDFTPKLTLEKNGNVILNQKVLSQNYIREMDIPTQQYSVSAISFSSDELLQLFDPISGDQGKLTIVIDGTVDITYTNAFDDFTIIDNYQGIVRGLQIIQEFDYTIAQNLITSKSPSGSGGSSGLCNGCDNEEQIELSIAEVNQVSGTINTLFIAIGLGVVVVAGVVFTRKFK